MIDSKFKEFAIKENTLNFFFLLIFLSAFIISLIIFLSLSGKLSNLRGNR